MSVLLGSFRGLGHFHRPCAGDTLGPHAEIISSIQSVVQAHHTWRGAGGVGRGGVAADRGDAEEARPLIEFHQVILFASHLESRGAVSPTLSPRPSGRSGVFAELTTFQRRLPAPSACAEGHRSRLDHLYGQVLSSVEFICSTGAHLDVYC